MISAQSFSLNMRLKSENGHVVVDVVVVVAFVVVVVVVVVFAVVAAAAAAISSEVGKSSILMSPVASSCETRAQ